MLKQIKSRLRRMRDRLQAPRPTAPYPPQEFVIPLPAGYPARRVTLRISLPPLPERPALRFSDHVVEPSGKPGRTVLGTIPGGFAISRDLGRRWQFVRIKNRESQRFIHVRALGEGEYLLLVQPQHDPDKKLPLDLLVVNEAGAVLAEHLQIGPRWHGCRSVDQANGTLMYAEYPSGDDDDVQSETGSRVLRSRDRGRTWDVVFARSARQIRHFHLLQAHPRNKGEWWLTSGDQQEEARIWVSRDDGDSWHDKTEIGGRTVAIGGENYPRSLFRLTDLAFDGDEVVWGSDDILYRGNQKIRGGHMFRSAAHSTPLVPQEIGTCRWQIRNIVDVGDFYIVLTQGSNLPKPTIEERQPEVLLMPKRPPASGPPMVSLLAIETHTPRPYAGSGFTYSKASRAAVNGTFFTFRAPFHTFPSGHQILRWDIRFS